MFFNELISGLRTGELVSFDNRMLFFVVDDSKLKNKSNRILFSKKTSLGSLGELRCFLTPSSL